MRAVLGKPSRAQRPSSTCCPAIARAELARSETAPLSLAANSATAAQLNAAAADPSNER